MDPFIVATVLAGVAAGAAVWFHRRARRAEIVAAELRRKVLAERIAARQDSLTGLLNRRAFYELGAMLLAAPGRRPLVAIMVDVDDFTKINESFGRIVGDEVLIAVGRRLADYARGHLVARLGGDEFVALLTSSVAADGTRYPDARDLSRLLAKPVWAAGRLVRVTVSVGTATVDGVVDLGTTLRRAESVMRRAKIAQRRTARTRSFPATRLADQPALAIHDAHAGGQSAGGPVYCRSRVVGRRRRRS